MWFVDSPTNTMQECGSKKAAKPAKCSVRFLLCLIEFGYLELKITVEDLITYLKRHDLII